MRRCTAGVLKLRVEEEEIYCWKRGRCAAHGVLKWGGDVYCWCTQVWRGGDVLLVYSNVR
jgi:hypothetical protein